MKLGKHILLGVFGIALQGAAVAQIYESTDAEGVPEFSDTPTTGSEVVDLQQTNVADEPPDIPPAPREESVSPAPARAAAVAPEVANDEYEPVYDGYDNNNNDDVRERRREEGHLENTLPENIRPGVEPHPAAGEPRPHAPAAGGRR